MPYGIDHMDEVVTYFEHTYIRGHHLRGRGNNYREASFAAELWNQHAAGLDGIARTTMLSEGIMGCNRYSSAIIPLCGTSWQASKRIYNNRRHASCKVLLDWNTLERRSMEISTIESRGLSMLMVSQRCCFIYVPSHIHLTCRKNIALELQ